MASALLAIGALAGCASAPTSAESNGLDNARMQAVERAARVHGVSVVWINAPRKAPAPGG
jgi:hypothetical protein